MIYQNLKIENEHQNDTMGYLPRQEYTAYYNVGRFYDIEFQTMTYDNNDEEFSDNESKSCNNDPTYDNNDGES